MTKRTKILALCLCLALIGAGVAAGAPALDLAAAGGEVTWQTSMAFESAELRVTGPYDFVFEDQFFGGTPSFLAAGLEDGTYDWSLVLVGNLSDDARGQLEKARAEGNLARALADLKASGAFLSHSLAGSFTISGGQLIVPGTDGVVEAGANPKPEGRAAEKDIQHLDDVIITFSLCVGQDCVNGESFGFDTIRLKENNLRLHFDDTSNSASFPSNDWRITINDSTNGGGSFFAIDDATANRTPFRIDAGAPANSLRVDSAGDVGIGNSNPVVDLHVTSGNTPTLRLEQNGSSGFTSQTWDLAGNEANFFLRDVTNGSALSFRVEPGADQDSLFIEDTNDVGIGTNGPNASLHVRRTNGTTQILAENTSAVTDLTMLKLQNNGGTRFEMEDTSANGETWFIQNDQNSNAFNISLTGSGGAEVKINTRLDMDGVGSFPTLDVDGSVRGTTFINSSARDLKTGFQAVDTAEVLSRLAGMEIQTWHYKNHPSSVQHMGPMAEDFADAFGLGANDRGISTIDASGVALAAIQALNDRLNALAQENAELKQQLEELAAGLE